MNYENFEITGRGFKRPSDDWFDFGKYGGMDDLFKRIIIDHQIPQAPASPYLNREAIRAIHSAMSGFLAEASSQGRIGQIVTPDSSAVEASRLQVFADYPLIEDGGEYDSRTSRYPQNPVMLDGKFGFVLEYEEEPIGVVSFDQADTWIDILQRKGKRGSRPGDILAKIGHWDSKLVGLVEEYAAAQGKAEVYIQPAEQDIWIRENFFQRKDLMERAKRRDSYLVCARGYIYNPQLFRYVKSLG